MSCFKLKMAEVIVSVVKGICIDILVRGAIPLVLNKRKKRLAEKFTECFCSLDY